MTKYRKETSNDPSRLGPGESIPGGASPRTSSTMAIAFDTCPKHIALKHLGINDISLLPSFADGAEADGVVLSGDREVDELHDGSPTLLDLRGGLGVEDLDGAVDKLVIGTSLPEVDKAGFVLGPLRRERCGDGRVLELVDDLVMELLHGSEEGGHGWLCGEFAVKRGVRLR